MNRTDISDFQPATSDTHCYQLAGFPDITVEVSNTDTPGLDLEDFMRRIQGREPVDRGEQLEADLFGEWRTDVDAIPYHSHVWVCTENGKPHMFYCHQGSDVSAITHWMPVEKTRPPRPNQKPVD